MKKIFFSFFVIAVFFLSISVVRAVDISPISPSLPGTVATNCTTPAGCNPLAYIENFYEFALLLGGVLAFGAVVYGGIKYIVSAGNPTGQHEGKEWIESALLGLLLLAGAYLILNTINPQLVNLQLPTLQGVTTGNTGGATGSY